ncbi:hypothetical protein THF1C08_250040 [Vibrio jasicida]|uniref:Uncharacterized protein n=1 Tax=Vibrio jasicida TaxID=766224 RepID=A0AAU9QMP4_9VIBR|nr:hypothetical protein THF1C08_250040 [Vibrio jasicida]CAH1592309.1 hypothetical protein THF1A12_250042 [Vibrio jasicida]
MNKTNVLVWVTLIVWLLMVACFFYYIEKESFIPVIHEFHLEDSSEL